MVTFRCVTLVKVGVWWDSETVGSSEWGILREDEDPVSSGSESSSISVSSSVSSPASFLLASHSRWAARSSLAAGDTSSTWQLAKYLPLRGSIPSWRAQYKGVWAPPLGALSTSQARGHKSGRSHPGTWRRNRSEFTGPVNRKKREWGGQCMRSQKKSDKRAREMGR